MGLLQTLGIAVGLAMDASAVSIGSSVTLDRVTRRQVFRFAFHFGLFQALMPVLGWLLGCTVCNLIATWDHWVAFALLSSIGVKAIWESFGSPATDAPKDPTRGLSLVLLSIATSIDALAVGLSLAMLDVCIWYPVVVIGVVTAALVVLGMLIGSRLGLRFGRYMRVVGGLVLIGIGLKILFEHLLS